MIDGYGSFELLGHGGFSTVYRAHQELLDRVVAVKVLHADLRDPDARRRFVRECRVTGRLSGHPNIITVFDAGTTRDHRPYLAMEYVPGGSLADVLAGSGPLAVPAVVQVGVLVADALSIAHRNGILHRDIKPANILLRRVGDPVLSDFGIASIEAGRDAATVSAAFTPGYAAPEVLHGDTPTVASDIFAFGATLFALLVGTPPFGGRVAAQILARVQSGAVVPLGREDVPDGLRALLLRMLHADPSRRPASASDVASELSELAAFAGSGSAEPSEVEAETTRVLPPESSPGLVGSGDGVAARTSGGRAGPHVGQFLETLPAAPARTPSGTAPDTRRRRRRGRAGMLLWVPVTVVAVAAAVLVVLLVVRSPADGSGGSASPGADAGGGAATDGSAGTAPPASQSCVRRAEAIPDFRNRTFADRYYCSTYVDSALYANIGAEQAAEPLDDSGFMREADSVWVICQIRGRANPVVQGNTNSWWLYTQGDDSRLNTHGYSAAWGYLPATAVSQGDRDEPVPGVPECASVH